MTIYDHPIDFGTIFTVSVDLQNILPWLFEAMILSDSSQTTSVDPETPPRSHTQPEQQKMVVMASEALGSHNLIWESWRLEAKLEASRFATAEFSGNLEMMYILFSKYIDIHR